MALSHFYSPGGSTSLADVIVLPAFLVQHVVEIADAVLSLNKK